MSIGCLGAGLTGCTERLQSLQETIAQPGIGGDVCETCDIGSAGAGYAGTGAPPPTSPPILPPDDAVPEDEEAPPPSITNPIHNDEEPADEEPADEEPADEEPADEEPADEEPADESTLSSVHASRHYPLYPYDTSALGSTAPRAPAAPNTTRRVVVTSMQQLQTEAQRGSVHITVNFSSTGSLSLRGTRDVELVIPQGKYLGNLSIGHSFSHSPVNRLRVTGPGMVGAVMISAGSADIHLEGLVINPAPFGQGDAIIVNDHSRRIAILRSIVRGGRPGLTNRGPSFTGSNVTDLMIAGCNFGGSRWAGGDDWAFRIASTSRNILIVDSHLHSGGGRATARFNGDVRQFTIDRSVLVNLGLPFSFMEEPGTTPMNADQIYLKNSRIFVDNAHQPNLNQHAMGAKGGSGNLSRFWQMRNLSITTRAGIRHDADWVALAASRAAPGEVRDYGARTHTYRVVSNVAASVPAFPLIQSPLAGAVRSTPGSSDPYALPTSRRP